MDSSQFSKNSTSWGDSDSISMIGDGFEMLPSPYYGCYQDCIDQEHGSPNELIEGINSNLARDFQRKLNFDGSEDESLFSSSEHTICKKISEITIEDTLFHQDMEI